jgi:HEAT repeat protein
MEGRRTNVPDKPDTELLLRGLRQYAPDAELRFESLAAAFGRGLSWYARLWCAVLLGRTAADPPRAIEVLASGLADPEFRVRVAVLGALARAGGSLALPLLRQVAADQGERGLVHNAAIKALGKVGGASRG